MKRLQRWLGLAPEPELGSVTVEVRPEVAGFLAEMQRAARQLAPARHVAFEGALAAFASDEPTEAILARYLDQVVAA